MVVIYAEKASLAKQIATALNAGKRIVANKDEPTVGHWKFTFHGEDAVLCHGAGHLCTLADAKHYGEEFKKWNIDKYPCIPDKFKKAIISRTGGCYKQVKAFFNEADHLINATDADREGELIFAYLYEVTHCKKPYKRVWIDDFTNEKLRYAFNHLKTQEETINMANAGRARDICDWLMGINLTIASTIKFGNNEKLTVGRVQTPTLALIVNREKEINSHVKKPFWKLVSSFKTEDKNTFDAEYADGNFENENEAATVCNSCNYAKTAFVKEKKVRKIAVAAPLLFNTTQLQVKASQKFDWSADYTSKIMQSLYEKAVMSYPRTVSEHLTESMKGEVTEILKKIFQMPEYSKYALSEEEWQSYTTRHFNDGKVDSHPAIIPTLNVPKNLDEFSDDEKKLYDLLVKSLIRIIYPKAKVENTSLILECAGHDFKASGNVIKFDGWYTVDARPEKVRSLPDGIEQGCAYDGDYKLEKGETVPPKRYTEADLLQAMELAGQKIADEETRTLMKLQKKGLGTGATRQRIIKSLFDNGYMKKKGKSIIPTEKGIFLIDTLPVEDIKSADMTGEMEKQLNEIAEGRASYDEFITQIKDKTRKWYDMIAKSDSYSFVSSSTAKLICPICGKPLAKRSWGYGCSGWKADNSGCNFSISSTVCGKKLTETQIVMLLTNKRTGVIKGFDGKKGKFDASLVLSDDYQVKFKF